MTALDPNMPLSTLVIAWPAAGPLFDRLGIDYCCHGEQSLEEGCRRRGLSVDQVLSSLSTPELLESRAPEEWSEFGIADLATHIQQTHHTYMAQELPALGTVVDRVVKAHAGRDPRLNDLRRVFREFAADIGMHMQKEEQILFPLCHELETLNTPVSFHCGSIRNPIAVMMDEHREAGHAMDDMKELTDGFEAPEDSCGTHRDLVRRLSALESDLHLHVHKENNVLFPRAVAQEDNLGR